MKRKKAWFKSPIHIMAPLLVASVMIMGTVAYFTDVEAVVNTIRFGQISIETNEEVSGLTKRNIGVTAQGNADCFISASDWLNYSGPITVGTGESAYHWYKNTEDGFWYLDKTLSSRETALFISSIKYQNLYLNDELVGGITEDMLTIPITSEAVQADNIVDDIQDDPNYQSGAKLAMEAFDRVANKNAGSDQ